MLEIKKINAYKCKIKKKKKRKKERKEKGKENAKKNVTNQRHISGILLTTLLKPCLKYDFSFYLENYISDNVQRENKIIVIIIILDTSHMRLKKNFNSKRMSFNSFQFLRLLY